MCATYINLIYCVYSVIKIDNGDVVKKIMLCLGILFMFGCNDNKKAETRAEIAKIKNYKHGLQNYCEDLKFTVQSSYRSIMSKLESLRDCADRCVDDYENLYNPGSRGYNYWKNLSKENELKTRKNALEAFDKYYFGMRSVVYNEVFPTHLKDAQFDFSKYKTDGDYAYPDLKPSVLKELYAKQYPYNIDNLFLRLNKIREYLESIDLNNIEVKNQLYENFVLVSNELNDAVRINRENLFEAFRKSVDFTSFDEATLTFFCKFKK